jgi:hypothetical protein
VFGLLAFWFESSPLPSPSDRGEAKIVAGGLQVGNNLTVIALAGLDELHTVISELLTQDRDDAYSSEGTAHDALSGGGDVVVEFARGASPDLDTIKVHVQGVWSRSKAQAFVDGLVEFGLVTPA